MVRLRYVIIGFNHAHFKRRRKWYVRLSKPVVRVWDYLPQLVTPVHKRYLKEMDANIFAYHVIRFLETRISLFTIRILIFQ